MPQEQVVVVLVALGSWAATELYKLLFPVKPVEPRVINALVSVGIGAGVALLVRGEPLDRVLLGAAAAVLSASIAAGVHRAGDVLRVVKEGQRHWC